MARMKWEETWFKMELLQQLKTQETLIINPEQLNATDNNNVLELNNRKYHKYVNGLKFNFPESLSAKVSNTLKTATIKRTYETFKTIKRFLKTAATTIRKDNTLIITSNKGNITKKLIVKC